MYLGLKHYVIGIKSQILGDKTEFKCQDKIKLISMKKYILFF